MISVLAFGTFDRIHPGHLYFLREAKKLGDSLTVVVSRGDTVFMLKGHKPLESEENRVKALQDTKIPNNVILGSLGNKFQVVSDIKPDIIALGYDQSAFTNELHDIFPHIPIKRIGSFEPDKYKSSILNKPA